MIEYCYWMVNEWLRIRLAAFEALALARGDGRHSRLLKMLSRVDLLILDEWGLAPLTGEQRRDLLELVDDRHQRGSTIITSKVPIENVTTRSGPPGGYAAFMLCDQVLQEFERARSVKAIVCWCPVP
jgi:hypothetical protein